jgi:hypothetical protein
MDVLPTSKGLTSQNQEGDGPEMLVPSASGPAFLPLRGCISRVSSSMLYSLMVLREFNEVPTTEEERSDGTICHKIQEDQLRTEPHCLGFGTRVLMADGTDELVQNLVNGSQLIGERGQVVHVINISGNTNAAELMAQLYTIRAVETGAGGGSAIGYIPGQGGFFDPFTVTATHRLTVGSSIPAIVSGNPEVTGYYAKVAQMANDPGWKPHWNRVGDRAIVIDTALVVAAGLVNFAGLPIVGPQCATREEAQARCDAWNAVYGLPRNARLFELTPVEWLNLMDSAKIKFAHTVKISVPIHFTSETQSLAWLDAAIERALVNARAHGPASQALPALLPYEGPAVGLGLVALSPVSVTPEFDARVEAMRKEYVNAIAHPGLDGRPNFGLTSPFWGRRYWSLPVHRVHTLQSTREGIPWPSEFLALFPADHAVHGLSAGGALFPGYLGHPGVSDEVHETDFLMPPASTGYPDLECEAIKMWIRKLTMWSVHEIACAYSLQR